MQLCYSYVLRVRVLNESPILIADVIDIFAAHQFTLLTSICPIANRPDSNLDHPSKLQKKISIYAFVQR